MNLKTLILAFIIITGFPAIFVLSRHLEGCRQPLPADAAEADLAFKADTLKKYSAGFNGLIADYYWMNALQYVGRKIVERKDKHETVQFDDLRSLNPRLLYPLLDTATTLDPNFTAVYSYGATVLPAVDIEHAIKFTEKGIAAHPDNFRFYHYLGYIHWKNDNFTKAAEVYATGATKPDAPAWMRQMGAILGAQGSSRQTAREIYRNLYANAEDEQTKQIALSRLMQVESLDELDAIRPALAEYQTQNKRCPAIWTDVFPLLRTIKLPNGKSLRFNPLQEPLDPSQAAYLLDNQENNCDARINLASSKVPPDSKPKL